MEWKKNKNLYVCKDIPVMDLPFFIVKSISCLSGNEFNLDTVTFSKEGVEKSLIADTIISNMDEEVIDLLIRLSFMSEEITFSGNYKNNPYEIIVYVDNDFKEGVCFEFKSEHFTTHQFKMIIETIYKIGKEA